MSKSNTFETNYKKEKCFWGSKPHKIVQDIIKFKQAGEVLDLGVGEGRDALFLAKKGFTVTGIDISETGIKKFEQLAKEAKLKVKGIVADIFDFKFKQKYDIIISIVTLHFLDVEQVKNIIKNIKQNTKSNGLNVIIVFTDEFGPSKFPYLFKQNELRNLYKDWTILKYSEEAINMKMKDKNENPIKKSAAIILAKK